MIDPQREALIARLEMETQTCCCHYPDKHSVRCCAALARDCLAALRASAPPEGQMVWYANRADGGADWKCRRCGFYTTVFGDNVPWCPSCDKGPPAAPPEGGQVVLTPQQHAELDEEARRVVEKIRAEEGLKCNCPQCGAVTVPCPALAPEGGQGAADIAAQLEALRDELQDIYGGEPPAAFDRAIAALRRAAPAVTPDEKPCDCNLEWDGCCERDDRVNGGRTLPGTYCKVKRAAPAVGETPRNTVGRLLAAIRDRSDHGHEECNEPPAAEEPKA